MLFFARINLTTPLMYLKEMESVLIQVEKCLLYTILLILTNYRNWKPQEMKVSECV